MQPVDRLLDARAALRPDAAGIAPARQNLLHAVGDARQSEPRLVRVEMARAIGKEVAAARLRRDVALAAVGARRGRQALGVAARRKHAVEIDVGARGDLVALAMLAHAEPVDLLEDACAVGIEGLARARRG